jgi:hypothetical protein
MLKQEVASLSARVALLESQKRDLELANKDLAERLADLATNTTNDKNNYFVKSEKTPPSLSSNTHSCLGDLLIDMERIT